MNTCTLYIFERLKSQELFIGVHKTSWFQRSLCDSSTPITIMFTPLSDIYLPQVTIWWSSPINETYHILKRITFLDPNKYFRCSQGLGYVQWNLWHYSLDSKFQCSVMKPGQESLQDNYKSVLSNDTWILSLYPIWWHSTLLL